MLHFHTDGMHNLRTGCDTSQWDDVTLQGGFLLWLVFVILDVRKVRGLVVRSSSQEKVREWEYSSLIM